MADTDHVTEGGLKKLAERIRTDVSTKITKPAAPSSTQMLTMNSAGVVALAAIPTGGGSSAIGNTVSVLQAADFSWPARPDSPTVFAIGAKNRENDPPGWLTENDVYVVR